MTNFLILFKKKVWLEAVRFAFFLRINFLVLFKNKVLFFSTYGYA
jgi:uncharacterized membrane protein